jgi:hypothetical protein
MHLVIALAGPKGSGKDTVGRLVAECYPHLNVRTVAFADPIKDMVEHIFKLDGSTKDAYDRFKRSDLRYDSDCTIDGRHVVREIGMLMRSYDEQQFNRYIEDIIKSDPSHIAVITDLRFDNEYIMLKKLGAKIIKIERPEHQYDGHITERGFDDHLVDFVLRNDGNLQTLRTRVRHIVDQLIEE